MEKSFKSRQRAARSEFDDDARAKRLSDADGSGHGDGRPAPALLDSGLAVGGNRRAGLSAGAPEASVGATDRVPGHAGARRIDGRVLRPSRRVAVVRTQRGEWSALSVSWLEVRRRRPMYRRSVRAGRKRLLQHNQTHFVSVRRAWQRDLDLYGAA